MIFGYLQAIDEGPRYRIRPRNLDGKTDDERRCWKCPHNPQPHRFVVSPRDLDTGSTAGRRKRGDKVYQWSPGYDFRLCWELVNPGALYLASTCHKFFKLYLSASIANNLILEFQAVGLYSTQDERIYGESHNARIARRTGFLNRLKRVKEGRRGSPLTRFMLDCRFDRSRIQFTLGIWKDMLESVYEIFGDELLVVMACFGGDVHTVVREGSPKTIKYLEAFDNPMITPRAISNNHRENQHKNVAPDIMKSKPTESVHNANNSNSPDVEIEEPRQHKERHKLSHPTTRKYGQLSNQESSSGPHIDSLPLSLHIYLGDSCITLRQIHGAVSELFAIAVRTFGRRAIKNLYFSAPNTFCFYDHFRQIFSTMTSSDLRFSTTLEELTLDCRMPEAAIIDLLSKLPNLKRLDLELLDIYSFPRDQWDTSSSECISDNEELSKWFREQCLDQDGNTRKWHGGVNDGNSDKKYGNILPAMLSSKSEMDALDFRALRNERARR